MDAIISIDSHHKIIFFNRAAESLFVYSAEQIIGQPLNILLPERYREQHTEHINHFCSTGVSTRRMGELGTIFGLRSNGEEFPLEASISQFETNGEKYLTVILRDITKRVENEKSLALSKETYENLFNSLSDAVFVLDTDGKILNINQSALNVYGYSREKFTGNTLALINAGGNDEMELMQSRIEFVNRGTPQKFEWKCVSENGWIIQNEFSLSKGTYFGHDVIIATAHDITARKEKEEQIKLFATMIKSVNDSIAFISLEGTILFVNKAFCKTYGYTEDEIIGKNIGTLVSPENPVYIIRQILSETLKYGWSGELRARRKDGEDIPVYLSTSAIYNTEGNPSGLVGVSLDLTKQKRLEGQLIHSHKMDSLRVLVDGIAHNFNNILAIIVGYSSLSRRENLSRERINNNLRVVLDAAERGALLVRQLFTFSMQNPKRQKNIPLNDTLDETVQIVQETFPKHITVSLDFEPSNPYVAADPGDLRQAFLNVLINSREAMPEGGSISISTRIIKNSPALPNRTDTTNEKRYVRLSIADTGHGMDMKTKEKIFDPFFTTRDIGEGLGLGLTITYGIIERYNGFIDVESAPGQGTSVHLFLPVAEDTETTYFRKTDGLLTDAGGSETILVVEDENAFRILLAKSLEKSGYTVLSAGDGREALELYEHYRDHIDIILLDIGLPMYSGHTILQRVRELNTDVKVIVMTGYDTDELMPAYHELTVSEIAQKPFDIDYIIDRVRAVLDS
jgi:two-component system, cell cycle sensor histidine kinase and response regulator CckA